MKYLLIIAIATLLSGCNWEQRVCAPDSIKVSPSMGWEIQKGTKTKQKPAVSACIEWKIPK
jgi:hypothetical protein